MVTSMTGYGKAVNQLSDKKLTEFLRKNFDEK